MLSVLILNAVMLSVIMPIVMVQHGVLGALLITEGATEKVFCGQCYKTFYGRKLRLFIISWSVCPWKAFAA